MTCGSMTRRPWNGHGYQALIPYIRRETTALRIRPASNVPGARSGAVSWIGSRVNSGSSADTARIRPAIGGSMTSGHLTRRRSNGPGYQVAIPEVRRAPTARRVQPMRQTSPGHDILPCPGLIRPASSGSSGELGFDVAGNNGFSMTCGNMTRLLLNGLGYPAVIRIKLAYYGTKGIPDPSNVPGARASAVSWIDFSGNALAIGGWGYDSASNLRLAQ